LVTVGEVAENALFPPLKVSVQLALHRAPMHARLGRQHWLCIPTAITHRHGRVL